MKRSVRIGVLLALTVLVVAFVPVAGAPAEEKAADLTADQAFDKLKTWDYDQPRRPLTLLEKHLATLSADPEKKRQAAERLTAVITDAQATEAARQWACQQLPLVATEAQVPAVVKLLDEPKLADAARRTLEAIPGEASLEALRAALGRLKGDALVGAINSLGVRRDAKSVAALASLLAGSEERAAAAAAAALGKIGTPEAADALAKAEGKEKLAWAVSDAQLRCAEQFAAAGSTATAEAIYGPMAEAGRPRQLRVAALAGLARCSKPKALPLLLKAIGSDDLFMRATAAHLARDLPGPDVTAALVLELDRLDAAGKTLVLGVLAERGDKSAAAAVVKLLDDKDDAVKTAAVAALGKLGDASCVGPLATLAAGGQGAARTALARLTGAEVDAKIVAMAAEGDPAMRAELLRTLGARRSPLASGTLLKAAADADDKVRAAALEALTAGGGPDCYAEVIQMLLAAKAPADAAAAEKAVLAIGGRMEPPADRVGLVAAGLQGAPAAAKPALLRVLGGFGGPDALKAVRPYLEVSDAVYADAAVRALAVWPDSSAAADLLKVAKESQNVTHRSLALRGYLRLARDTKDEAARLKMLDQVRPIATTVDAKRMLLGGLSEVADPAALGIALGLTEDKDVQAEAVTATMKIARALLKTDRAAVQAAMKKLAESAKDKAVADQAEALRLEALKPQGAEAAAAALQPNKQRSEAQKKELAKRAPKGYRLACYLDCGPDIEDGTQGGPTLRFLPGKVHMWPGAEADPSVRFGTIAWEIDEAVFEAAGLSPRKTYQVGFTWWDYDHETRVESVWMATGKGEKKTKVLDKTPLPSRVAGKPAEEKTVQVPRELYPDGTLRILFRNESQPNAVVSELWLWESEAESAAPAAKVMEAPAEKPAAAAPEAKPSGADKAQGAPAGTAKPAKVLIVTGQDSAHDWRPTAPALAELLRKDPRLEVRVVEDPDFLASDELKDYAVVVLHFQNPKPLPKSEADRTNLQKFVEGGKGLVIIHFACGAFQEWPEFRNLAGRAWDPKLRAHDPHGKFRVEITDVKHPVTQGLKSFETEDELYTCLAGDKPIEVLATAKSKVDGKDYPMAFVLSVGKGRVFHTALGHDVKAITNPPVAELYRRATAWAAGL